MRYFIVVVVSVLTAAATAEAGTTYWVDSANGNDANPCSDIDGPTDPGVYKQTPLRAWTDCMVGGDTLHLKASAIGYEGLNSPPLRNGAPGAETIIEGEGAASTMITGGPIYFGSSAASYVIVQDLWIVDNIYSGGNLAADHVTLRRSKISFSGSAQNDCIIQGAAFATIEDNELTGCGVEGTNQQHGIYQQGPDALIQRNYFHDMRSGMIGYVIQCYHSGVGASDRCKILDNRIESSTGKGIVMDGVDNEVRRNTITGMALETLLCGYPEGDQGCQRAQIDHNVITGGGSTAIVIGRFGAGHDSSVRNNLVTGNGGGIAIEDATGVSVSNNACTDAESCGTTGKQTITDLTACTMSAADFTLRDGSPCVDTGTIISGYSTTDPGQPGSYTGTFPDIGFRESPDNSPPASPSNLTVQ
jgi:parallel beta-helix repeat protein